MMLVLEFSMSFIISPIIFTNILIFLTMFSLSSWQSSVYYKATHKLQKKGVSLIKWKCHLVTVIIKSYLSVFYDNMSCQYSVETIFPYLSSSICSLTEGRSLLKWSKNMIFTCFGFCSSYLTKALDPGYYLGSIFNMLS